MNLNDPVNHHENSLAAELDYVSLHHLSCMTSAALRFGPTDRFLRPLVLIIAAVGYGIKRHS